MLLTICWIILILGVIAFAACVYAAYAVCQFVADTDADSRCKFSDADRGSHADGVTGVAS